MRREPLPRRYYNPAAAQTYVALPDDVKPMASHWMEHLRFHPEFGKPLDRELEDCKGVYVYDPMQPTAGQQPDFRIVYQLWPNDRDPERIDVISIGPRIGLLAYEITAAVLAEGRR